MIEPADEVGNLPRAFLRVGGVSLARHQLALALGLGCDRIICIASQIDPDMVALQHAAEGAGASFHVVSGGRGLVSLIAAGDEVIAFGEGLLAWPETVLGLLGSGAVVLVQPIETGLAAGFERLDMNHAAAAALRLPGRLVERLAELPPDVDVLSALHRIALQAGVPTRLLPPDAHESGRWTLVRSETEAHGVEAAWIRLHTAIGGEVTPGLALARRAVRAFGPALLHAGSSGTVVAISAGVLGLLGLVAGKFDFPVAGFGLSAFSWVLFHAAAQLARVEREALGLSRARIEPMDIYGWVIDAMLALQMAWAVPGSPPQPIVARLFAPVMLLGLTRLVPRLGGARWTAWLEDRAVLAFLLALAALLGFPGGAIAGLSVLVLVCGLALAAAEPR